MIAYNDVAPWNYSQLPAAFGCTDWLSARVATNGELNATMETAESCGQGAYIEVCTDKMASSPLALALHQSIQTLYGNR